MNGKARSSRGFVFLVAGVALAFEGLAKKADPGESRPHRGRLHRQSAFTLLEMLLALALVALLLVAMNTFIFSMAELWGQRTDLRLFDQHVRAVTRFLNNELRASALPPAGPSP